LQELTFTDALQHLRKDAGHAPQPGQPSELRLNAIATAAVLFQPRDVDAAWLATDSHVKALTEAVKNKGADVFDPLTVWWSGRDWYLIDGHHRLMALRKAEAEHPKLKIDAVPVTVFAGNLHEAIAQAAALNAKDKLAMRKEDKLERAWKLVCLGEATKSQIQDATTVSEGTIATMRRRRKELVERGDDPLECLWRDAKRDKPATAPDEDWLEKHAREWVRRFVKTFGTKLIEQPEIAARALELYSERLPLELVRLWPTAREQFYEEEKDREF